MAISNKQIYRTALKGYPDVLDIKQLCAVLDVSKKTAYKFIKEKNIHCIKVGREYRIPKASLLSCLFADTPSVDSAHSTETKLL